MCVLTYLPLGRGNYFLTNNRDESPSRPSSLPPKTYDLHGLKIVYPKDPLGGGTWIAHSEKQSVVLLNGGHKKHTYNPPYRQSRGMVVLDFFEFVSPVEFYDKYQFEGIEPFTLVIIGEKICEIRWDENGKSYEEFETSQARIWSSVTLYTDEIIKKRETWFYDYLKNNPIISENSMLYFHENGGDGDETNAIKMQRGELVKTIGISQIVNKKGSKKMSYYPI
jgi:hypothetical protein